MNKLIDVYVEKTISFSTYRRDTLVTNVLLLFNPVIQSVTGVFSHV